MIEDSKHTAEEVAPVAPMATAESPGAAPAAPPRGAGRNTLREWLFRTRALQAARAGVSREDPSVRELRRRARLSYELAERVLDPIEPLRAGGGVALAADLFRQAAYWALCAGRSDPHAVPASQLWTAELESELAREFHEPEALRSARHLLCDASFVSLAELSADQQLRMALEARRLASGALVRLERSQRLIESLLWQRLVRLGACAILFTIIATVAVLAFQQMRQDPDLALGKPWRASSSWADCEPVAARCGGARSRIFFHTNEDAAPWIEYDLGTPVEFSRVFVRNRSDSAPDRAIPLLIEVSSDRQTYREVARRTVTFSTWNARFKPQRARFVRLRVPRKSWLHLEQVSIYRSE